MIVQQTGRVEFHKDQILFAFSVFFEQVKSLHMLQVMEYSTYFHWIYP
jgi:hypothetical protein